MPWLLENGNRYTFEEIKNGAFEHSSATEFCSQWLNGQTSFTLQTSGSTGTPKRIDVTRHQLAASARITAEYLNLKSGQTALVCLDISFVAGLMMLVRALEVGMNIVVAQPEANPLQSLSAGITIDFVALVPYQVEAILKSPQREGLNKIRNVIIGGAPLPGQVRSELRTFTNAVYATYGMTETLTHIALQKLNGPAPENTFRVLPGFEIDTDESDCLIIKTAHLGSEPIITNDIVELVSKDQFRWLGRMDGVINTGGVKIIPEKTESLIAAVFEKLNLNNCFFVAGIPHLQFGQSVALIIEGTLQPKTKQALSQTLAQALSRYENPKSIHVVEQFVYTRSGKINRAETLALIITT
ncbi:MAG: AMP-binding protein [Cyclobacteriaceae bacterium]|nr:AMP-binding protein [Cyclobacteriaceae bacterium]